jgi:triacylglycerol lipase
VLPHLGCAWTAFVAAGLIAPLLPMAVAASAAPAAGSARHGEGPGPAMLTPRSARRDALACYGVLDRAPRAPVLLIPGTAVSPEDNWKPSYLPVLRQRGHGVCTVALPHYGTRNVEHGAEYVATAIRTMARRSTRPISTIGHSQGAFLPHVALRTWPDLSARVDDVIGLAGVYDRGSRALAGRCEFRCQPVLHQLATGSRFLASISRRRLPGGPSYTNIGALGDRTVTPQPAANRQRGAVSIHVQDVCPGRTMLLSEHAMIVGDNAALALTLDALYHRGPASVRRLGAEVCRRQQYPGFDPVRYLAAATLNTTRTGSTAGTEPKPYCRRKPACRDPRLRGYLTTTTRFDVRRNAVTVRANIQVAGGIKLVLGDRTVKRLVGPGRVALEIRRPARGAKLLVRTRPRYYTAWAVEDSTWVRAR